MAKIERIGVSLEKGLLKEFDEQITVKGYVNRSEALRDLIRDSLASEKLDRPNAHAIAAVFLVYDHHSRELSKKLMELQHSHVLQTISSMHIHLDRHDCLEIIVLKGKVKEIASMADRLISLKGVKLGRINLLAMEEDRHSH